MLKKKWILVTAFSMALLNTASANTWGFQFGVGPKDLTDSKMALIFRGSQTLLDVSHYESRGQKYVKKVITVSLSGNQVCKSEKPRSYEDSLQQTTYCVAVSKRGIRYDISIQSTTKIIDAAPDQKDDVGKIYHYSNFYVILDEGKTCRLTSSNTYCNKISP